MKISSNCWSLSELGKRVSPPPPPPEEKLDFNRNHTMFSTVLVLLLVQVQMKPAGNTAGPVFLRPADTRGARHSAWQKLGLNLDQNRNSRLITRVSGLIRSYHINHFKLIITFN